MDVGGEIIRQSTRLSGYLHQQGANFRINCNSNPNRSQFQELNPSCLVAVSDLVVERDALGNANFLSQGWGLMTSGWDSDLGLLVADFERRQRHDTLAITGRNFHAGAFVLLRVLATVPAHKQQESLLSMMLGVGTAMRAAG